MLLLVASFASATEPEPVHGPLDRDAVGVGMGLELGYPAGVTIAWRGEPRFWFEGALGWAWGAYAHLSGDVMVTVYDLPLDSIDDTHWPISVGIGARGRFGEGYLPYAMDFGFRVPVAVSLLHDRLPFEVYVDVVPGVSVFPRPAFLFEGGAGFRYYFGAGTAAAGR